MSDWISKAASHIDDQWCNTCQRVCCDCHVAHRAELATANVRIAELEAALEQIRWKLTSDGYLAGSAVIQPLDAVLRTRRKRLGL